VVIESGEPDFTPNHGAEYLSIRLFVGRKVVILVRYVRSVDNQVAY